MPRRPGSVVTRPQYPVWIRAGRLRKLWAAAILALVATAITAFFWPLGALLLFVSLPLTAAALVPTLAFRQLSGRGGGVQGRIHGLIRDAIQGEGRLLDIGCGSGELLIGLASSGGEGFFGIDYWGDDWEYSCSQAQGNAAAGGYPNLQFVRGTASMLPFADNVFARVVSCLTFHEVRDVADPTTCLGEAVRVLAPHGRFAFVDLFDDPHAFGGRARVLAAIDRAGGLVTSAVPISGLVRLVFPLNLATSLKHAVLIVGRKPA